MNTKKYNMEKGFFITSNELSAMIEKAASTAVEKFIKTTKSNMNEENNSKSVLLRGYPALCEYFGFSKSTAQKLKQTGQIPFIQRGRVLYFKSDEVLKALQK